MTASASTLDIPQRLLLQGQAYNLCARLLSADKPPDDARSVVSELRRVLRDLGRVDAEEALNEFEAALAEEAGSRAASYLRPLAKGDIPPYETSYELERPAAGGKPFHLADISGFYQAFGFRAAGERPDHVAPELEFVSLLFVKEAYARISGNDEGAIICEEARARFLAEHLFQWLPSFTTRLSEAEASPALNALGRFIRRVVGGPAVR
jgi:nitrate reductase assembly molybdenum cofactor insertion protein NarJ